MPRHLRSATDDDRPAALLDLSKFTTAELGALVDTLREALSTISDADDWPRLQRMWYELAALRLEVRHVFLRKFFEIA